MVAAASQPETDDPLDRSPGSTWVTTVLILHSLRYVSSTSNALLSTRVDLRRQRKTTPRLPFSRPPIMSRVSVPRPWTSRHPIWQLMMGLLGLLVAAVWFVSLLTHTGDTRFRLLMIVVWAGLGLVFIANWRRAVKEYEARAKTN